MEICEDEDEDDLEIKTPALAVCHDISFEHVLQHVGLAQRLSASSQGMSATAATHPGIRSTTVQGLLQITNRAGKFSKFDLSKEQIDSESYIVPRAKILKQKSLLNLP